MKRLTILLTVLAMLAPALCLPAGGSAATAHKHNWQLVQVNKAPTCTEKGMGTYRCNCGEVKRESIAALGHSWGKWKTTKQATCVKEGQQTRTCSRCQKTETKKIPATGKHKYGKWKVTKEATCMVGGKEKRTCSVCGGEETRSTYAKGHLWDKGVVTKEATAEEEGEILYTCTRDPSHTKTEAIPVTEEKIGISFRNKTGGEEEPEETENPEEPEEPEEDKLRIVVQPEGGTISHAQGETLNLSVEAAGGEEPYIFTWYREYSWLNDFREMPYLGSGSTLTVSEAGVRCFCVVYDAKGDWARSDTAEVKGEFYIVEQPRNANLYEKDAAVLSCRAAGGEPFQNGTYMYAWYDAEGNQIGFSDNGTVSVTETGEYHCDIQDNGDGFLTTNTVTVYSAEPLRIVNTAEDVYLLMDEEASLWAEITGGTEPVTVTWQRDGLDLPTECAEGSYYITGITGDGSGEAHYIITARDGMDEEVSASVYAYYKQLEILSQPQGGVLRSDGSGRVLSVVLGEGEEPFSYILYKDGAEYASENDTTVYEPGSYYYHIMDTTGRWADSDPVDVTEFAFYIDHVSASGDISDPEGTATLTAEVVGGDEPVVFHWTREGEADGSLNSTGPVCVVATPGRYVCEAEDDSGHRDKAEVTVSYTGDAPKIIQQPRSVTIPHPGYDWSASSGKSKAQVREEVENGDISVKLTCLAVTGSPKNTYYSPISYTWEMKNGNEWTYYRDQGTSITVTKRGSYRCVCRDTYSGQATVSDEVTVRTEMICRVEQIETALVFEPYCGTPPYKLEIHKVVTEGVDEEGNPKNRDILYKRLTLETGREYSNGGIYLKPGAPYYVETENGTEERYGTWRFYLIVTDKNGMKKIIDL